MPVYVPTEECLDSIHATLRALGLTYRPGSSHLALLSIIATLKPEKFTERALLATLNGFAEKQRSENEDIRRVNRLPYCNELLQHPRSTALAFSLVLLWQGNWNRATARGKFREIADRLLNLWLAAPGHTDEQKLKKTVSQVLYCGIRRDLETPCESCPALDVLYFAIRGAVGKAVYFLRGKPIFAPRGEEGAAGKEFRTHLDRCWEEDFADAARLHAGDIRNRLCKPLVPWEVERDDFIQFKWSSDGDGDLIHIAPFSEEPIRAGSKRTLQLAGGTGILSKNGKGVHRIGQGQRLILQVRDDQKAVIRLATSENGGKQLQFGFNDDVKLVFTGKPRSTFELWNCTCGTWHCDQRHRSESWDPVRLPRAATFLSFVYSAVNGPQPKLQVNSFISGMYYALLCDGD